VENRIKILTALSHAEQHPIEAKILACNPKLEAFRNSKTLRNDNSSSFGKDLQIYFVGESLLIGALFKSYLFEKSRVISISEGER
jgi:myosin heavy subunit